MKEEASLNKYVFCLISGRYLWQFWNVTNKKKRYQTKALITRYCPVSQTQELCSGATKHVYSNSLCEKVRAPKVVKRSPVRGWQPFLPAESKPDFISAHSQASADWSDLRHETKDSKLVQRTNVNAFLFGLVSSVPWRLAASLHQWDRSCSL